jgi:hypothetical protein
MFSKFISGVESDDYAELQRIGGLTRILHRLGQNRRRSLVVGRRPKPLRFANHGRFVVPILEFGAVLEFRCRELLLDLE